MNENQAQADFPTMEEANQDPFGDMFKPKASSENEGGQETPEQGREPTAEEQAEIESTFKRRRERRLEKQLKEAERLTEELNNRIQRLADTKDAVEQATGYEYLKGIYGDETPEGRNASDILLRLPRDLKEEIMREVEERIESRYSASTAAEAEASDEVDEMMNAVEDEYDVDLSDSELRNKWIDNMERMSPKDSKGNIVHYADPYAVWEVTESQIKKPQSNAKTYAQRGLTPSSGAAPTEGEQANKEMEEYLKRNDLI